MSSPETGLHPPSLSADDGDNKGLILYLKGKLGQALDKPQVFL